ncbi:replicative helicase loader/inhibitor [Priestia aryabhattai]|uniref:replicative helicase loader/inhibitor n=1 Tax=Priestia aryabhattai TaxID=412384 RepID=UPI0027E4B6BC|nr:replicative helicase loader/inhibitor [Priestia aryabhattai]WJW97216.1 replicative helicase loader/inhibitor [Priestia aryabhattai]
MKKIEVVDLLDHLSRIYLGRFKADERTLEAWYFHLADEKKDEILNNLKAYVASNKFPPVVSDLLSKQSDLKYFNFDKNFSNGESDNESKG